jgi:hypothetical protein
LSPFLLPPAEDHAVRGPVAAPGARSAALSCGPALAIFACAQTTSANQITTSLSLWGPAMCCFRFFPFASRRRYTRSHTVYTSGGTCVKIQVRGPMPVIDFRWTSQWPGAKCRAVMYTIVYRFISLPHIELCARSVASLPFCPRSGLALVASSRLRFRRPNQVSDLSSLPPPVSTTSSHAPNCRGLEGRNLTRVSLDSVQIRPGLRASDEGEAWARGRRRGRRRRTS